MGSSPFQMKFFIGCGIDQHPIGFNVRISISSPIQFEWMIFVERRQGTPGKQEFNQCFQLDEVFAALLKPLHVPMKLS